MDDEILKTVHSIFGESIQIVDFEKTSTVREEEVILINGTPVTLDGKDGDAIRGALLTGNVPSTELLNQLLCRAGVLRQPVQIETSLSVQSSTVITEEVSVARGESVVNGQTSETKEDYTYNSSKKEVWEPLASNFVAKEINMAYIPKLNLVEKSTAPQSSANGAVGISNECKSMDLLLALDSSSKSPNITTKSASPASGIMGYLNYNFEADQQRIEDNGGNGLSDEDENSRSLDTDLSYHSCAFPFKNLPIPMRSTTTTLLNSTCGKSDFSKSRVSETVKSVLGSKSSFSSGYETFPDRELDNPQNASTSDIAIASQSSNDSKSSCNLEEAYLMTPTYSRNANHRNHYKTILTAKEGNNVDLQERGERHISKKSSKKNLKNPNLGDAPSMSGRSCVSNNPSSSSSSSHSKVEQNQKQSPLKHGNKTPINVNSSDTSVGTSPAAVSVKKGLVFRDGNLVSGPLEALIAHIVPSYQYYPDRSFIFSFLLSVRLFIRPHELLARISDSWESDQKQQSQSTVSVSIDVTDDISTSHLQQINKTQQMYPLRFSDEDSQQKAIKSAQNCIQFLSEWIDTFPYDFRDERLMQHVRVLARKCVYIDNNLGKKVSTILQSLVQRLTVLEKYEQFLQMLTTVENNESCATTEDLVANHKSLIYPHTFEHHKNSTYIHGASISHDAVGAKNEDMSDPYIDTLGARPPTAVHYKLSSSPYTSDLGTGHQIHQQHNNHQNNSLSNSVNTVCPSGGGSGSGGISIGGCASSNSANSVGELVGICDLCPNANLLAHQLTHIELERLSHIGPEEFVQAFAKENHLEPLSDMKKTRNLESYVQWFNRLSYFTATEIVKYPKKKQRVRIIEYWIETARECFNIGNFNSLMAIIAGLNLSPISRLKKTWSKIQSAKFSVLEHQMDPTSNFNSYRSTLKAAIWRSEGATNERERIIIPFFSLLVKDLYFLNEGCSNRLPNGHINFEKFRQLAKQVMEFNTWRKVTCPFEKLPKVIKFLQISPVLNENTLSIASFECEPPENNQEKGRYKTLKSETKQHQQNSQT